VVVMNPNTRHAASRVVRAQRRPGADSGGPLPRCRGGHTATATTTEALWFYKEKARRPRRLVLLERRGGSSPRPVTSRR
jgi:hypothetical protein